MQSITQYFLRQLLPTLYGQLTRLLYNGSNLSIGTGFKCEGIPRILIDRSAVINIGNDVYLRRNVEIRAHGQSSIHIGNQIRLDRSIRILSSNQSKVSIGNGSRIGLNTVINGGDDISVGENVLISGFVYLQSSMHNHQKNESINQQGYSHKPIQLADDVWIGAHVTILPGISLPKGTVIGSNAVMTSSPTKEYTVWAGVPAREIKERTT